MRHRKYLIITLLILCMGGREVLAQVPQVERTIEFAGMKLQLTEQAQQDIQSSVDALYRSERHFNIMLERVDLYMPLIEPIFQEYGVPDEFKYLVIQESALVPDAVSSSNAVGFWQFKEASATELNMRIDRQIDERMNIISASEGAAKYFLRSNAEFDNWLYTLQSYMVGQGGTSRSVDKRLYGAREMKVDEDTHWYVKKFLAYKVAFEPAVGKQKRNLILYQYTNSANKTLHHIAREFDTEEEQLVAYNKWLKTSHIPDDKVYSVIVPLNIDTSEDLLADAEEEKNKKESEFFGHKQKSPGKIPAASPDKLVVVEFNDLKAIVAREGDNIKKLAATGEVSEKRFLKFNDMASRDPVIAGQIYYLERKHRKARVYEHVFQEGENLWQVSQQYGLRLSKLLQKNRLRNASDKVKPGQVLWLRFMRPRNEEVEYRQVKAPKENLYASTKKKIITTPQTPQEEAAIPPKPATELETATAEPAQKPAVKKEKELPETQTLPKPERELAKAEPNIEENINPIPHQGVYPADTTKKAANEKPAVIQEKLLFPADNGSVTEQTENKAVEDSQIKVVQKDTAKAITTEGKIQAESEGNDALADDWGDQSSVFESQPQQSAPTIEAVPTEEKEPDNPAQTKPVGEASSETPARAEDNAFSVEEPVNFVGEKTPQEENPAAVQQEPVHKVKAGETLYSLSRQYKVSVQDLIQWNKLPAQPILSVGQELKLAPTAAKEAQVEESAATAQEETEAIASAEAEKEAKYHTVSAGESMYRVARMYNVTIKDIMQWNNKDTFDLREGEKLIVGKAQN